MTPIIYIPKNSQKYLLCRNYPELPPHFLSTNTNKLRCKYSFANLLLFESRSHLSPVTLVRVPWLEVPNGLNFWTGFKILKSENWGWEQTSVSQTLQNIHFSPSRYQIDCNNTMFISYRPGNGLILQYLFYFTFLGLQWVLAFVLYFNMFSLEISLLGVITVTFWLKVCNVLKEKQIN